MIDITAELNRAIEAFVSEVSELAKQVALATIQNALGGQPAATARERRSTDELGSLADTFYDFVVDHPGLRIEQINPQLGTTTKLLARPIRQLIASGAIKTKGTRRAMTYFASGGRRRSK